MGVAEGVLLSASEGIAVSLTEAFCFLRKIDEIYFKS
jgi:hypothetical protein